MGRLFFKNGMPAQSFIRERHNQKMGVHFACPIETGIGPIGWIVLVWSLPLDSAGFDLIFSPNYAFGSGAGDVFRAAGKIDWPTMKV